MIVAAKPNARPADHEVVPMKLSSTNTYALHAALLLARSQPGIPVPCRQLRARAKCRSDFCFKFFASW